MLGKMGLLLRRLQEEGETGRAEVTENLMCEACSSYSKALILHTVYNVEVAPVNHAVWQWVCTGPEENICKACGPSKV